MPPYSGLKIVHDQRIQESLERYQLRAGQEKRRRGRGLLPTVEKARARLATRAGRKQESNLPGSAQGGSCAAV